MNSFAKRSGTLLFGLLLLAGAGLHAEPMGEDGPGPRGEDEKMEGRFEEMTKELGLTKEQAEKLRAHRQSQRQAHQNLFKEMQGKREALRAELEKTTIDAGKAKSLNEELKDIHNKMADQRLKGVLEVRKILSAEQFKKLRELGEKRREDRRGGNAEGRPSRPGPGRRSETR